MRCNRHYFLCMVAVQADWNKVKVEYIAGHGSLRDIAEKFSLPFGALAKRSWQENWSRLRKENSQKVVQTAVISIQRRAADWVNDSLSRADDFKRVIKKSLSQTENFEAEKIPLSLDQLTKAELRIDDIGRRALGIPDTTKQLDVTSGGMPLGAFAGVLNEVREMVKGGANMKTIDVDGMAGKELTEDVD